MIHKMLDRILVTFFCVFLYYGRASGATIEINFENYLFCDRSFQINQYDVYHVFAEPLQNAIDGRDRCKVQLIGTENRGMVIYLKTFRIFDCGTTMEIYDDDDRMLTPFKVLTCDTKSGQSIETFTNNLIIVLVKQTTESMSYRFSMDISIKKTSTGNVEEDGGIGGGMSTGAIIGIVVAAILLILIIIGISIFYYLHKKRQEGMKQSEPSIFVTEPSKKFPTYPQRNTEGSVSSSVTSNGGGAGYRYVNYAYSADGGDSVSSNEHSSYSTNYSAAPSSDTCRTPKSSMKSGGNRDRKVPPTGGRSGVRWSASNMNEVIEIEKVGNSKSVPKSGHQNEAFDGSPTAKRRSRSPGGSSKSSKKSDGPMLEIWNTDPKPPPSSSHHSRSGHSRHRSRSRSPHSSRRGGRTKSPSGERRTHDHSERRSRSPGRPRSGSAISSVSRLSQPVSISSDV